MTIQAGDKAPEGRFNVMNADGPGSLSTKDLFGGKKVVIFSVPGAFTPTCSRQHLPGFVEQAGAIKAKGVDTVACTAVNDVFVMDAWGKSANVGDNVMMLADGNGDYAKALGLELDGSGFGLGQRGARFALVVEDGTVTQTFIEEGGAFEVSSAENVLANL
jgi:glutaredoxin/glutathione-dependent peroxiredoxin